VNFYTWRFNCQCPRCGKQYILADVNDSMVVKASMLESIMRKGKFMEKPDNFYCDDCGTIKQEDVVCVLPLEGFAVGLHRTLFIISFIGILATVLIVVLFHFIMD